MWRRNSEFGYAIAAFVEGFVFNQLNIPFLIHKKVDKKENDKYSAFATNYMYYKVSRKDLSEKYVNEKMFT